MRTATVKRIGAVVVTWNGADIVRRCLRSLEDSTAAPRIYVVDNASSDGTATVVASCHPRATLVRLRKNIGFARANNVGMRRACEDGAEHVFLLNQDARIAADAIAGLAALQEARPEFGLLSPLHLSGTGERLDRRFARHLVPAPDYGRLFEDGLLKRQMDGVYDVTFVNAAAWMLSRECIRRVGLFNPVFAHFWEDRELADRVLRRGFRAGIAPSFHAFHDREQGDGPESGERERLLRRGRVLYTLSRERPGVLWNVLSAVRQLARPGRGWARLLGYALLHGAAALRNRREAMVAERPFVRAAEEDERLYAL